MLYFFYCYSVSLHISEESSVRVLLDILMSLLSFIIIFVDFQCFICYFSGFSYSNSFFPAESCSLSVAEGQLTVGVNTLSCSLQSNCAVVGQFLRGLANHNFFDTSTTVTSQLQIHAVEDRIYIFITSKYNRKAK